MMNLFKKIYSDIAIRLNHPIVWLKWYLRGCPAPAPELIKRHTVKNVSRDKKIFIETGTHMGDMVEKMKNSFDKIFSIEIEPTLAEKACQRFAGQDHIKIICGDSGQKLGEIIEDINVPCLFWLDGHYSGGLTGKGELETPIIKELLTIFHHPVKNHTILIDDARLFTGQNDYPTIDRLTEFVNQESQYKVSISRDIIFLKK